MMLSPFITVVVPPTVDTVMIVVVNISSSGSESLS